MITNILTRILALVLFLCNMLFTSCTISQGTNLIPIKSERNITLVTVKIGDVEIPKILLDTGLPFDGVMIYNPDYRDSFDLTNAVRVNIGGAGDGEGSYALMLDSAEFMLGDLVMKNQRILVLQNDIYKGFPTNGIIGYSIFGHYAVEMDYDKNIMILHDAGNFKADTGWTEIPLYFKNNNIPWMDAYVVVENEEPILLRMYIDFASRDAVELLEKPDMKFTLPEVTEDALLGRGLSGDIYGKKGRIYKLIIGQFELKDVTAVFPPAKTRSKQENADGILGNNSLRRFNLIFNYANKKLYIKPNSHFNEKFE
jgi:hypothetical protein